MGGGCAKSALLPHLAYDSYGKRRALDRVGTDAKLIKQNERARRQLIDSEC